MANTIILKDLLMKETLVLLQPLLAIVPFANRDYEGTLKQSGDTVTVQIFPNLTITTGGTAGADITSQYFVITSEDLKVDQVAQANYTITNAEELKTNLNLRSEVAKGLALALAKEYDSYLAKIIVAGAGNAVSTAALTKSNIYAEVEKMRVLIEDDNANDEHILFIRPEIASLVRQSPEFDGFKEGFDLRLKGIVSSMYAGFKVISTTQVPANVMFAIDRNSVNFVEQMKGMKITEAEKGFRYNMLLETLYVGKVFTANDDRIVKHVYTLG